jgi:hypothetical protein
MISYIDRCYLAEVESVYIKERDIRAAQILLYFLENNFLSLHGNQDELVDCVFCMVAAASWMAKHNTSD